jgi:hypothetical protein
MIWLFVAFFYLPSLHGCLFAVLIVGWWRWRGGTASGNKMVGLRGLVTVVVEVCDLLWKDLVAAWEMAGRAEWGTWIKVWQTGAEFVTAFVIFSLRRCSFGFEWSIPLVRQQKRGFST